jgi:hypothetical protein
MMKENLLKAIKEIRGDSSLPMLDEASIKSGVVLRLLSLLGWNPFDVSEVKPEYTVESKRVDFSLRMHGTNKAFIEVKRPNEDLESHQEQLLGYSFREGVRIAILTNGLTWWFYLPLNEGSWEQRRFFTADFAEQPPESIAERIISLLSKPNIASGDAVRNAEDLYRSRQRKDILRQALPKAWHKLINDPDDLLVDLLIETTERLSGFRPEAVDVQKFLEGISHPATLNQETTISRTSRTVRLTAKQKGALNEVTAAVQDKTSPSSVRRAKATILKVILDWSAIGQTGGQETIAEPKAVSTFVKTLARIAKHVGNGKFSKLQQLRVNRGNLLSPVRTNYHRKEVGGYHVLDYNSTDEKAEILRKVVDELGIPERFLDVEIIT